MDIVALRAEIKSWERAFKAENQRNPSLDDIKALPKIAAKYKLYKKLSKESAPLPASEQVNDPAPSTPPCRSTPLPGPSLLPKSRPTPRPVTDTTSNPFSPSKASRRKFFSSAEPTLPKLSFVNRASIPPSQRELYSSPSPEPLPPLSAAPEPASLLVKSAVKKARKRLRGDLVSPSPKKMRTISMRPGSSDRDSDEEADASYIAESPMKASSNGKDFRPIFEEGRLPQPNFSAKKGPFGRSKSISDPFGNGLSGTSSRSMTPDVQGKLIPLHKQGKVGAAEKQRARVTKSLPIGNQPYSSIKSNLRDNPPTLDPSGTQDYKPALPGRKRSSSVDADDLKYHNQSSHTDSGLLPPSPPPYTTELKQRDVHSRATMKNRKKPKLAISSRNDEDPIDEDEDLEVVELTSQRRASPRHGGVAGDEDEASWEAFAILHKDRFDDVSEIDEDTSDGDEPEIKLPDDLRNVLYISSSHRTTREGQALVEALLQGTPGPEEQRGEVWGIGETDNVTATTTDDEWAGEGIPWEVGEL